jgi:hypothetical protein
LHISGLENSNCENWNSVRQEKKENANQTTLFFSYHVTLDGHIIRFSR